MRAIRLYGHVYDSLEEFKRDGETFDDAISRLLPDDDPDVIEYPEEQTMIVQVRQENHRTLTACAGENVNVSDVVEYHLERQGVISQ